jgi:hypothetical protein
MVLCPTLMSVGLAVTVETTGHVLSVSVTVAEPVAFPAETDIVTLRVAVSMYESVTLSVIVCGPLTPGAVHDVEGEVVLLKVPPVADHAYVMASLALGSCAAPTSVTTAPVAGEVVDATSESMMGTCSPYAGGGVTCWRTSATMAVVPAVIVTPETVPE